MLRGITHLAVVSSLNSPSTSTDSPVPSNPSFSDLIKNLALLSSQPKSKDVAPSNVVLNEVKRSEGEINRRVAKVSDSKRG